MFPIQLPVEIHMGDIQYTSSEVDNCILPYLGHVGYFGFKRKHHIHEGIDLYCPQMQPVRAMYDGEVVSYGGFTGESVGTPFWNETEYVLISHGDFCINYGEIIFTNKHLKAVKQGDILGYVVPVLRTNKNRPMCMLHVEMYTKDTKEPVKEWSLGQKRPPNLLDPFNVLLKNATMDGLVL